MATLRPSQEEVLAYSGGKMGIAAVPGSGKTFTLSHLAAKIITEWDLDDDQEVLIVTMTNSAVENFYSQLSTLLAGPHWFPNFGYRVRTLHGLANDIIREQKAALGLSEQFEILDDREATSLRNEVARAWWASHPDFFEPYLKEDLSDFERGGLTDKFYLGLIQEIAEAVIRTAKNLRITPEALQTRLALYGDLPLAKMGGEIFASYQRSLHYRAAVDFDDLICLALEALESDHSYLDRLRFRWPVILEDEAQDSSLLQEEMLKLLSGDGYLPSDQVNWVRVGDPNQAIYATFTTADPRFLLEFLDRPDVNPKMLPESGRFSHSIICLANYLASWTANEHPIVEARAGLQPKPLICPILEGDPQERQPDDPTQVRIIETKFTDRDELAFVAEDLQKWLPDHTDSTVAVLSQTNLHLAGLTDVLQARNLPFCDSLLKSSTGARTLLKGMDAILKYLCEPKNQHKLAAVYQVWREKAPNTPDNVKRTQWVADMLRKQSSLEAFLWSEPGKDPIDFLKENRPLLYEHIDEFRRLIHRWTGAAVYPVDQVILTVAQDLLTDPLEWAIIQKLAASLRRQARRNPTQSLPELLKNIGNLDTALNYKGFGTDENGFNPAEHKGEVVLATLHKAKGLEWDRVYILSANAYDFPSGFPNEEYRSENRKLKPGLNMQAEALEQLEWALSNDPYGWYEPGKASQRARFETARERLRLLYVGITRARRELVITWNTGRYGHSTASWPLIELASFWKQHLAERIQEQ